MTLHICNQCQRDSDKEGNVIGVLVFGSLVVLIACGFFGWKVFAIALTLVVLAFWIVVKRHRTPRQHPTVSLLVRLGFTADR